MITALIFLWKCFYWIYFGWWLEPIKYFKRRKIQKMQDEITKANYEKLQHEKKEEN